jgi:hypothetical protein
MDLSNIKTKFKNKQNLTFLILGILMFVLVFIYIFYSIDFLAVKIKEVLNVGKITNVTTVKFDIEKIKALEIGKAQQ